MELHQERFKAWLFSQPMDRVIDASDSFDCFLCNFIKDTTSISDPVVGYLNWIDGWSSHNRPIPEWAITLISHHMRIDSYEFTCGQMQDRYRQLFPESVIENENSTHTPPRHAPNRVHRSHKRRVRGALRPG